MQAGPQTSPQSALETCWPGFALVTCNASAWTALASQPPPCEAYERHLLAATQDWVLHWLRHLQICWKATETDWNDLYASVCPDFILPLPDLASLSLEPFSYGAPMSYPQALALLRWAVQNPGFSQPLSLLQKPRPSLCAASRSACSSATAQLRLSDEARRRQGHHKQQSVDLYGRDDTIDALWLQQQIALACSEGWRPSRPISRRPSTHP